MDLLSIRWFLNRRFVVWGFHVEPVDFAVGAFGHDLPGGESHVAVDPRVVVTFSVPDVRADGGLAPRRNGRRIEVAEVPPVETGFWIEAVAIHACFARFGNF